MTSPVQPHIIPTNHGTEFFARALYRSYRELVPFTRHYTLSDHGLLREVFSNYYDALVTGVGFMGEDPERALQLAVRGGKARSDAEFSSLHLSLLWPSYSELTAAVGVERSARLELQGPPRGIVLLVGVICH